MYPHKVGHRTSEKLVNLVLPINQCSKVTMNLSKPQIQVDSFDAALLGDGYEDRRGACSLVLRDRVYVLGGQGNAEPPTSHRQLMIRIDNQTLETLDDLPFTLNRPLCTKISGNEV